MKAFIVLVLVQAALVLTNPEVSNGEATTRDRGSRILASYSQQTVQNTAAALGKLENVTQELGNVASEITDLTNALNASDSAILAKLGGIDASLKNGSDIVTRLDTVGTTMDKIVTALTDDTDNNTLPGQLSVLYTLLESKLGDLEKILGYDDFPSATTTAAPAPAPAPASG